jgi:hypothetical protein
VRNAPVALACSGGLALELAALAPLADFQQGTGDLLLYFAMHGAASALLAWVAWRLLPPANRRPARASLALLFCFAFFIPLLGAAGMLLAALLGTLLPAPRRYAGFGEVERPAFQPHGLEGETRLRIGAMRSLLLDPGARLDVRLRSLVAIQSMPMRVAAPMLRKLLADPAEDIRLLAYGMLDAAEKRITSAIDEEQRNLDAAGAGRARLGPLRRLAELNWELVYAGLVQGDVRRHVLDTALAMARDALRIAPSDPGLWLLRGRMLQSRGDAAAAAEALSTAVSCGVDESRALPYLAEVAFDERRFALVRDYLALLATRQVTPLTVSLVRFWLRGHTA